MVLNIHRDFDRKQEEFHNSTDFDAYKGHQIGENFICMGALPCVEKVFVPCEGPVIVFCTGVPKEMPELCMKALLGGPQRYQIHFQEPGYPNQNLSPKPST